MKIRDIFDFLVKTKIAVISPHPDDAALSVGGLIARLNNTNVFLITCFTQSCSSKRSDSSVITNVRSMEDKAYSKHIRARLIHLGLPDTSIRTNVGLETARATEEAQIHKELTNLLRPIVFQTKIKAVFVPLAIGEHLDHFHCRQVAIKSLATKSLIFYEDLPYGQFVGGPGNVKQIVRQQFPNFHEVTIMLTNEDMEKKLLGLDYYRSQINSQWREDVEKYALELGKHSGGYGERYWFSIHQIQVISSILFG